MNSKFHSSPGLESEKKESFFLSFGSPNVWSHSMPLTLFRIGGAVIMMYHGTNTSEVNSQYVLAV